MVKDNIQPFLKEPGMHGDPSRVSRQPQSVEEQKQAIEARFAVDPQWAETHPYEVKILKGHEALAKYLIGVEPPQTPDDLGTPEYRALKAYTQYEKTELAVLTAPDYEGYDPDTMRYPSDETNRKADEADSMLTAIANERRTNAAFDEAYLFYRDIGFTTYMAELYKPQESSGDERMHAALARTNAMFRGELDNIDKS
jgi:hypothetical protein